MGIYSSNTMSNYGGPSVDLYSPCVQELGEGYDINYTEAAIMAVAECEKMHNDMMKSIGINELHYYESYGEEIIYEAVDIQGIFKKIKAFFVKLLDKVKAIFHAFVAKINSLAQDNKDFANKYRSEFMSKWNKVKNEFEFKGYKFTIKSSISNANNSSNYTTTSEINIGDLYSVTTNDNANKCLATADGSKKLLEFNTGSGKLLNVDEFKNDDDTKPPKYVDVKTALNTLVSDINNNSDAIDEKLRGKVLHNVATDFTDGITAPDTSNTYDAQEFNKELFEIFRNGDSSKQKIEKKDYSPSEILSFVSDSNHTIHEAEKAIKKVTKMLTDSIRAIENTEKNTTKKMNNIKASDRSEEKDALSAWIDAYVTINNFLRHEKDYYTQAVGAYLTAVKDKTAQYKAIIAKVIAGGKKMQNESYNYSDYGYNNNGSYIESVIIR